MKADVRPERGTQQPVACPLARPWPRRRGPASPPWPRQSPSAALRPPSPALRLRPCNPSPQPWLPDASGGQPATPRLLQLQWPVPNHREPIVRQNLPSHLPPDSWAMGLIGREGHRTPSAIVYTNNAATFVPRRGARVAISRLA